MNAQSRSFVVLLALLQGLLLYSASTGYEHGWWPFSSLSGCVYWYTLVLSVPTVMMLSVERLDDWRFWQHALGIGVVYALLAWWAGWNAGGAPGLDSWAVLRPFGVTLAVALFILLPFLQCRIRHQRWHAPYADLFELAWQNTLIVILVLLFTGLCWAVLWLWGAVFELLGIEFFSELFDQEAFEYLATGIMVGLGVLIGRSQQHPLHLARRVLLATFRGLLPLLALIVVMFSVTLPFTGLQPVSPMFHSTASILLWMLVLLILFTNAVYQDGERGNPYPKFLRYLVEAALLLAPVLALLAMYALYLRVDQYGWSADRLWAALAALVLAGYAFGYAWTVTRRHGEWLAPVKRINVAMALVVIALAALVNSPTLDVHRISVRSQLARLEDGRTLPAELDLEMLRTHSGRMGYRALQNLAAQADEHGNTEFAQRIKHALMHGGKYVNYTVAQRRQLTADSIAEARERIQLATGTVAPEAAWWQALLDLQLYSEGCLLRGSDCVLLARDLNGDGAIDMLLCILESRRIECRLSSKDGGGQWQDIGEVDWYPSADEHTALVRDLRVGELEVIQPVWPQLRLHGMNADMDVPCCAVPSAKRAQ